MCIQVSEGGARETGECTETLQETDWNSSYAQEVTRLTVLIYIQIEAHFITVLLLPVRKVIEKVYLSAQYVLFSSNNLQFMSVANVGNNHHSQ